MSRFTAYFIRFSLMSLGYAIAVLIAVSAIILAMLPFILVYAADDDRESRFAAEVGACFRIGLTFTFLAGLPGFLLTLYFASVRDWSHWLPFACAGALNAIPVVLILGVYLGLPTAMVSLAILVALLVPCLPVGFLSGFAYWAVIRNSLGHGKTGSLP